MVFDDEFYTVPLLREVTIPPNWTDFVQHSPQIGATDNIDLKDNFSIQILRNVPEKSKSRAKIHLRKEYKHAYVVTVHITYTRKYDKKGSVYL